MSITKTLLAGVAGTVLVGSGALASEPLKLTETQMDDVTAGIVFSTAFAGDVIGFGFGTVSRTANVFTSATESVVVRPTPPILAVQEDGTATASLLASFTGIGGVTTLGTFATVTNFPN